MANNYTQSSSVLEIPADKLEQAILIVERTESELEHADECVGFEASFEGCSLWIRDDGESFNPDHVVDLVQTLLDELQIDEPFVCSWAYTCSKPRVDEFGGGACAVRRGKKPIWCDARDMTETQLEQEEALGPIETPHGVEGGKETFENTQEFGRLLDGAATRADQHQKINSRVAPYCGWVNFEPGWWRHPEQKIACEDWDLPAYMNDLNACREMEATLRPKGTYLCEKWWWYRSNLIDICSADSGDDEYADHLDATASQRVRAFLRTMQEPNIDRS
jgi:hypothetical protein